MIFIILLSVVSRLPRPVHGVPIQNITISVPDGTTTHGDPNLICTPAAWTDIAIFFLANYLAHAATIKAYPGESDFSMLINTVICVLFPTRGIIRGLDAIVRHSVFRRAASDLQQAKQSGALCMVVRSRRWQPNNGDALLDVINDTPVKKRSTMALPILAINILPDRDSRVSRVIRNWLSEGMRLLELNEEHEMLPGYSTLSGEVLTYSPRCLEDMSSSWAFLSTMDRIVESGTKVHGAHRLPPGYTLALVPRDAVVYPPSKRVADPVGEQSPEPQPSSDTDTEPQAQNTPDVTIGAVYSWPKVLASLFQTAYAAYTLYRSRGDQIARFGYAAFALTVAPYAVMSFVNLIGNLVTPDYPTLYLVRSDIMGEAEKRPGAVFQGVVGELNHNVPRSSSKSVHVWELYEPRKTIVDGTFSVGDGQVCFHISNIADNEAGPSSSPLSGGQIFDVSRRGRRLLRVPTCSQFERSGVWAKRFGILPWMRREVIAVAMIGCIPLAIIGGLSGFQSGESTRAERVWTMIWLAFGMIIGPSLLMNHVMVRVPLPALGWISIGIFYGAPAIGGMVVVGQMLISYGNCIRIG